MALYKYIAKDKEGKEYERTVDVKNRTDIYNIIREEGGSVISIREANKLKFALSFGDMFGRIKTHQKITLAKNLGSMIEAGLPVTRALEVMGKQSRSKPFKKLVATLGEDVSHGKTLSDSMKKYPKVFSSLFVSMVKAGEESGTVASSLNIVASQMEKSYLLLKKVRGAMIYPAVIISVMIVISILMLIFMVPTLTATFEGIGIKLPLPTRMLIASSDFLVNNTLLVLSAMLGLIIGTIAFFRNTVGKALLDSVSIRLPVIGEIVKEVESARTARTFSALLSAGVEVIVALDVTIDVIQNHLYKDALKRVRTAIEKGESMSVVFTEHGRLYPLFVGEMVAVGEETGKISEMLVNVANYYENEVDQKTKDLSTIIEPVLMIIIGVGVGFFAISMLAPTYSLVDYI
jgi:type IV pilus assembly protein PilC